MPMLHGPRKPVLVDYYGTLISPATPKPQGGWRWREPGLLKVSKQIRREVCGIYYGDNHFVVTTNIPDFSKACDCIANETDLIGAWPFDYTIQKHPQVVATDSSPQMNVGSNFTVCFTRHKHWEVAIMFSLANLVYNTKLSATDPDPSAECAFWYACFGIFSTTTSPSQVNNQVGSAGPDSGKASNILQNMLSQVIRMALKAKVRQYPFAWLEQDFLEWAMSHLSTTQLYQYFRQHTNDQTKQAVKTIMESRSGLLPWSEMQKDFPGVASHFENF